MTYKELAQQSLDIQDACNLSGVVHALSRGMEVLWAEAHRIEQGTEWVNKHPIVTLFLDKLASLNGTQSWTGENISTYTAAYSAVHKIIAEEVKAA